MTQTAIRRLMPADAALFRAIRLEALDRNPEAFGSTLERESKEPLAWFADRLNTSTVFGAWHLGAVVGTAGLYWAPDPDATDPDVPPRAHLWTVYVQAAHRGSGLGRALVETAIATVRPLSRALHLRVNSENEPALRLYRRLGFEARGLEKNALERGGRFYDEVLMVKEWR